MHKHTDAARNVWIAPDNELDRELLCQHIAMRIESSLQRNGWSASVSVNWIGTTPHLFAAEVLVYRDGTRNEDAWTDYVDHDDPDLGLLTYVRGTSDWRVGLRYAYAEQDVPELECRWIGDGSIALDDLRHQMGDALHPELSRLPRQNPDLLEGLENSRAYARETSRSTPAPKPRLTLEDEQINF